MRKTLLLTITLLVVHFLSAQDNAGIEILSAFKKAGIYSGEFLERANFTKLVIKSNMQGNTEKPMEWYFGPEGKWAFINESQKIDLGGNGNLSVQSYLKTGKGESCPKELSMLLAFFPEYLIHLANLGFVPHVGETRNIDGVKYSSISYGPTEKPFITYYYSPENYKIVAASYPSPVLENDIALLSYGNFKRFSESRVRVPDEFYITHGDKPKEVLSVRDITSGIGTPALKNIVPEAAATEAPASKE